MNTKTFQIGTTGILVVVLNNNAENIDGGGGQVRAGQNPGFGGNRGVSL